MTKEERSIYQKAYRKTPEGKIARRKEQQRFYYLKYKPKYKEYKNLLLALRTEKGGKCSMCGYSKEISILHFHHLRDKVFEVCQYRGIMRPRIEKRIREEAEKCILICPNCHAELHLKERKIKYGYESN